MSNLVELSVEYYPKSDKGAPVSAGTIYVGVPDTDPTVVSNQVQVTALQENGSFVNMTQPISLSGGGVPLYNGSPVSLYAPGDYSLTVLDINGAQVYYVPSNPGLAVVPGNFYYPDYSEADQGVTGNNGTVKYYVDQIGTDEATLYFKHNSGNQYTEYLFSTTEVIPSNIKVIFEKGARIIDDANGADVTIKGSIQAGEQQQIFAWGNGSGDAMVAVTLYPQWFGGFGDGITHVEVPFQQAIDAIQGAPAEGGKIIVPHGTYLFYDEVIIRDDLVIEGNGMPELFMKTVEKDLFITNASESEITFRNLKIIGLGSDYNLSADESAININNNTNDVLIDRCKFYYNKTGVRLPAGTTSISVTNCLFLYFSHAGVWTSRSDSTFVHNNRFTGDRTGVGDEVNGLVGIWIAGGSSVDVGDSVVVTDNVVEYTYNEGIIVRAEMVVVTGNVISNAKTGTGGSYGLIVEGTGGAVDLGGGVQTIVSNNTVYDCEGGIAARHDPANTSQVPHEVIIANNIVRGITSASNYGIQIGHAAAGLSIVNVVVIGNLIYDTAGIGIGTGNANGCSVIGNLTNDTLIGISMFGNASPDDVDDNLISGNFIHNCEEHGISYNGRTGRILNNLIVNPNTSLTASRYGISVAGTSPDCVVKGNIIDGGGNVDRCIYMAAAEGIIGQNECKGFNIEAMTTNRETGATIQTLDGTIAYEEPTSFDTTAGAIAATLTEGFYIGQIKTLVLTIDGGTDVTLTVDEHTTSNPEVFTFADENDTLTLIWLGEKWGTLYNNGVTV